MCRQLSSFTAAAALCQIVSRQKPSALKSKVSLPVEGGEPCFSEALSVSLCGFEAFSENFSNNDVTFSLRLALCDSDPFGR